MITNGTLEGLTRDELARIKSVLLERRRQLLSDIQSQQDADSGNASEASAPSSHLADLGSDREASDINLGRREAEVTEIQEIDDAMERIRVGSFGRCETCRKAIGRERLLAIPYALLCLPCKKEEESEGRRRAF